MQNGDTLPRVSGLFGKTLDQRIEARIMAGEARVAQPERRGQCRHLGVAQPLLGAAVFVDAVHHDLDMVVLLRHREGGDLVAVAVEPVERLPGPSMRHETMRWPAAGLGVSRTSWIEWPEG